GMLPAALAGIDGRVLLERALAVDPEAARALGARIAAAALAGRDKLVLRPPAAVARLADWIEQLVAESTGKGGRGGIPVVDGAVGAQYADCQVVTDVPPEPLALGAACVSWEYATWELCVRLGVNAFDQPDVEQAKALARAELEGAQGGGVGAQPAAPLSTLTPDVLRRSARNSQPFVQHDLGPHRHRRDALHQVAPRAVQAFEHPIERQVPCGPGSTRVLVGVEEPLHHVVQGLERAQLRQGQALNGHDEP